MNLQESIRRILREIEEERVQIRLGRSAERHFGIVQNIIINLDGEDITSEDDVPGLGKMNIVIKDDEIIVGDIFIPEKYRRKGIATIVYQKISDYFGLPIVSSTIKGFNQTKEGGYIWKNRDSFNPRNLQESIRRILREEIKKKFPRPNENVDKSIYKWLNLYFDGSQIYKEEFWKNHGFAYKFCKNGREIADLRVIFEDKSPDWGPRDKRPTSERSVEEVWLIIYPFMVDLMGKVFPVRKNYLIYLIEEWFEDTKLDEIQKEFNRNDLSLDYVSLTTSRKKGEICVPPVPKPEGVTMQDMMDYIKKTTLFSYNDMEEHEEEEPGWIENLYLAKLHGEETKRVNDEDRENNPEPFDDRY
jgi:hypothetical protein